MTTHSGLQTASSAGAATAATSPSLVCAWCRATIHGADGAQGHGVCLDCLPLALDQVMARLTGARPTPLQRQPR